MFGARSKRAAAVMVGFAVLAALAYRSIFRGEVVAGVDAYQLGIPDATFLLECIRNGEWPLWTPYERLGQPFAATLQTQAFYPPRILAVLAAGPIWGITLEQLFHAFVACAGTYWACRGLGRSRLAAFFGGAVFGLGPLYTELAHVPNMAGSVAWSGAMLAAGIFLDRDRSWRAAAVLALVACGSLSAGSPETWLWQALVLAAVTPRRRGVWGVARKGLAMGFAFPLAAVVVVPTVEFLLHSVRLAGVAQPLHWSAPPSTVLGLFWLLADLPRPEGEQHLLACNFQGTLVFILALLALRSRGPWRRLLLVGGFLGLLSLGEFFGPARLLLSVPPFSLFRYPVKYLVGTSFCLALAAARGLDLARALAARFHPSWRRTGLRLAILVAPVLVLAVLRPLLPVRAGAWVGLVWGGMWALLGGVVLFVPRDKRRARRIPAMLAALGLLELGAVSAIWGTPVWLPATVLARPSRLAQVLPAPTVGRVSVQVSNEERSVIWPTPEAMVRHSRDSVIPLRNVEDRIAIAEGYGPPEPRHYVVAMMKAERAVMDLAGVTHYLRVGAAPYPDLEKVEQVPEELTLYRAATALPRAYLSYSAKTALYPEAIAALIDPAQPFRKTTLLAEGKALSSAPPCAPVPPVWRAYYATWLALTVDACAPAYLVVTDSYFPGWDAEVDGRSEPIRRANLLVRAVLVPPGRHEVRMQYRPASFRWGAALTLLSLGLVVAALTVTRRRA